MHTAGESCWYERRVAFAVVSIAVIGVNTISFIVQAVMIVGALRTNALSEELQPLVFDLVPSMKQKLLEHSWLPDDVWHMSKNEVARPL
jgi:hypothetical protein